MQVSGVGNQNFLYSGLGLAGWESELNSSSIINWFISLTKSSGFIDFANVSSWGSIGVIVSACCGERNLKTAISEFRGIVISLFCRFKAERYKYPFGSVLDKDDVRHSPVLSSKLSFGSTIPQTSLNILFDIRPHLSVVCWFGAIVIFSNVLTVYCGLACFSFGFGCISFN